MTKYSTNIGDSGQVGLELSWLTVELLLRQKFKYKFAVKLFNTSTKLVYLWLAAVHITMSFIVPAF